MGQWTTGNKVLAAGLLSCIGLLGYIAWPEESIPMEEYIAREKTKAKPSPFIENFTCASKVGQQVLAYAQSVVEKNEEPLSVRDPSDLLGKEELVDNLSSTSDVQDRMDFLKDSLNVSAREIKMYDGNYAYDLTDGFSLAAVEISLRSLDLMNATTNEDKSLLSDVEKNKNVLLLTEQARILYKLSGDEIPVKNCFKKIPSFQ